MRKFQITVEVELKQDAPQDTAAWTQSLASIADMSPNLAQGLHLGNLVPQELRKHVKSFQVAGVADAAAHDDKPRQLREQAYKRGRVDEWTEIRELVYRRALAPGLTDERVRAFENLLLALDSRRPR
jgi:hypothetical protein